MLSHTAAHLACRAHLLALSVCTTGLTSLSAIPTGFARATGSFIDDGFAIGMELTPSGFAINTTRVITAITALTITVSGTVTTEAPSSGRALSVLLPSQRAWENVDFTPTSGVPYITEEYLPGPTQKVTVGSFGQLEALPMYLPRIYVPKSIGRAAASLYADAVLHHFAPETSLTMTDGSLRVRGDVAPFPGQLFNTDTGFAVIPISIPLRYRATNTI